MVFGREINGSADGNPVQDANQAVKQIELWLAARALAPMNDQSIFEAMRLQMQKIEDRWRAHSLRAAEILDDIGRSETMDDVVRNLFRLEQQLLTGDGTTSVGAGETGSAPRRRAARTLLRL